MSASTPVRDSSGNVAIGAGVAAIVGLAAAGAVIRGLRSATGPSARSREAALVTYLHDHLGGADLAIRVVDRLRRSQHGAAAGPLFEQLHADFTSDRQVVEDLLARLGESARSLKRTTGRASGALAALAAGGDRGDLSLLRTLEGLAIAVQGKRCLWRALHSVSRTLPSRSGPDFLALEAGAVRQWESIEQHRLLAARDAFATSSGREGAAGLEMP